MKTAFLILAALLPLAAQEIKLPASLNRLAGKASEVVDVTLDSQMLKLASRFLSKEDPEEAKVKTLVTGLKGVYVKVFEFENEGEYNTSDVEDIRTQLRAPGWTRIVGAISKKSRENAEIFIKLDGDRVGGIVILAAEPKELAVVNIVGNIDLEQLSELGGHFGIPEVEVPRDKKKAAPAKD
ncbi:MAG TPA: DUF4252 domain-containing protein [Bryobacteraceae bacterium]